MLMQDMFDMESFEEVDSSMIQAVGAKGDYLVVFFKNGAIYRYPGVADRMQELVESDSIGKYFHKEFRDLESQRLINKEWPVD